MEQMNLHVMDLISELQTMRRGQEAKGVSGSESDRCGFPYESFEAFSMEPLGFLETAVSLQIEANEIFNELRRLNRHSPLYLRISGRFEKILAQLGSCCITKAVIETRENASFDLLKDLEIEWLRGMLAYNFRKCCSAFTQSRSYGNFNTAALDLSIRFSALDKRLLATAGRIEKIRSGALEADLTEKAKTAGTKPDADIQDVSAGDKQTAYPLAPAGRSLPIDKAAVLEAEEQRAEESPELYDGSPAAEAAVLSEAQAVTDTEETCPEDIPGTEENAEGGEPADESPDGLSSDEKLARGILLKDAVDRGDRRAYMAVIQAKGAELRELWQEFLLIESQTGYPLLKQLGIVEEDEDPPPEECADLLELSAV